MKMMKKMALRVGQTCVFLPERIPAATQHHQCLYWFPEINRVTTQLSPPSVFPAGVTAAKQLSQQGPEEQTVLEVFLRLFTPTSGGVVTSDAFISEGTTQACGC